MIVAGLDTETTGLDPDKGHKIIEICLQLEDYFTGRKLGSKTWRVHPNRSIDPRAEAVHKISLDMLKGAPTFDAIAPTLHKILSSSHVFVAHNAMFDLRFLAAEFSACGLTIPDREVFCTMDNGRWACADGKAPKLGELCWALGIEYDKDAAHAADYDVQVMMQALRKGVDLGYFTLPAARVAA